MVDIDLHVDALPPGEPASLRSSAAPLILIPALQTPQHVPGAIASSNSFDPGLPASASWGRKVVNFLSLRLARVDRRRAFVMVSPLIILFVIAPAASWFLNRTTVRGQGSFQERLAAIEQTFAHRAGVFLTEDFRSGFENWDCPVDQTASWKFDETGFVLPAELAAYRPSQDMADYTMEFLGQIDKKALPWAFRIRDFKNYYAAKLIVARPGPLPTILLRHYAVINGKETAAKDTVVPLTIRGDTLFHVRLETNGSDYSVHVQDRLVGYWSDSRILSGGVGFFSNKGEISRIRWLHVAHQYDVLGRICAYLSPSVRTSNRNRSTGVGNNGQP